MGGLSYTVVYQIGQFYIQDSYLNSDSFQALPFVYRCLAVTLWGKFTLYKYVAAWLISEGSCTITGITYHGKDKNDNDLWDACANIKIRKYEKAVSCGQKIESFNINTNKWMAKYIFKRLKFLGNKSISQSATLFFLALWHGLYSGYFMCFCMEFLIIKFEKELWSISSNWKYNIAALSWPPFLPVFWLIRKIYAQFALSYSLVSFCLFTVDKWGMVYSHLYFCLHIAFGVWLIVYPIIKAVQRPPRHTSTAVSENCERSTKVD